MKPPKLSLAISSTPSITPVLYTACKVLNSYPENARNFADSVPLSKLMEQEMARPEDHAIPENYKTFLRAPPETGLYCCFFFAFAVSCTGVILITVTPAAILDVNSKLRPV